MRNIYLFVLFVSSHLSAQFTTRFIDSHCKSYINNKAFYYTTHKSNSVFCLISKVKPTFVVGKSAMLTNSTKNNKYQNKLVPHEISGIVTSKFHHNKNRYVTNDTLIFLTKLAYESDVKVLNCLQQGLQKGISLKLPDNLL